MKNERVSVFIDGSNFYNYLKDKEISLPKGVRLSYTALVDFLASKRTIVSKKYYVGIVRNYEHSEKMQGMIQSQQKFLAGLENEGFDIGRSKIMYDTGRIREKGTDVNIAVDMVAGAAKDLYDTAIIISSDTDLIPAINFVRSTGRKIEYVGFSHAPSFGLIKNTDASLLLRAEDIERFKSK